jgi:Domain of unknown function (DUF3850)
MTTHELKTLPVYWDAIERGDKPFEVRRDDRGFQKGDTLVLIRYQPGHGYFYDYSEGPRSMKRLERRVTYILTGGQFGIEPGYVVMGLEKVES